ncbi:MAG: DUF2804 domain-containing protein, partial [archaeon]|nr:DUF2804 domain-containing protein [archaeon]
LNPDGTLVQQGYATKLILKYNRENIKQGWARIKEWDYYAVLTEKYGIAITVSEMGLMSLYNVVFLDFESGTFISDEVFKLLTKFKNKMPLSSETGDVAYSDNSLSINLKREPEKRILTVDFPEYNNGQGLKCDLVLQQDQNMDSMVIATSWKKNRAAFYYNQKVNCMPATGSVVLGGKEYVFNKDNKAYGVLDWGRGVWTYKNRWYWGSLSGEIDGHTIGWNIGYGFSDRSPASENMLFYDGKAHKLEDITFNIPTKGKELDYMSPWTFTSSDGRFEMVFEPIVDRNADVNLLVFRSMQHQVFGLFTGDVILDDGTKIHVEKMLGFAEDVLNRW